MNLNRGNTANYFKEESGSSLILDLKIADWMFWGEKSGGSKA